MTDDVLKALVTQAIFEGLEQKKRDELVREAIAGLLLAERGSGYGYDARSKLQRAFDDAVYSVAREIVGEAVRGDEAIKARIRELAVKGAEVLLADEQVVQTFASAVSAVLSKAARP